MLALHMCRRTQPATTWVVVMTVVTNNTEQPEASVSIIKKELALEEIAANLHTTVTVEAAAAVAEGSTMALRQRTSCQRRT